MRRAADVALEWADYGGAGALTLTEPTPATGLYIAAATSVGSRHAKRSHQALCLAAPG